MCEKQQSILRVTLAFLVCLNIRDTQRRVKEWKINSL